MIQTIGYWWEYKHQDIHQFLSLGEELILFHLDRLRYCVYCLFLGLSLKYGIGQSWIFFLQHFEFPFDLVPCFGHMSGNQGKVTSVFLEQLDQGVDLFFGPHSHIIFASLNNFFLLLFMYLILQCDLIDESRDCGNRRLSTRILMTVAGVNSHAEDITGRI